MKTILTIASILAIGFLTKAMATSYAPPQDRVVRSPNGQYSLEINVESSRHEIRKGKKVLWSFERRIWHDEFYLSNDGQRVLWVAWENVQVDEGKGWRNRQADEAQQEEAVVVYSPDGVLLKKTFAEVSNPVKPVGPGPIGNFWRVWRGTTITQKDDEISIAVKGKNEDFTIDLSKIEKLQEAEQGSGQPATRPESESEGGDKSAGTADSVRLTAGDSFSGSHLRCGRDFLPAGMTGFSEALELLVKHTPLLATERCRIEAAAGRVLREEIRADLDFPPYDRVMMDGYAMRAADVSVGLEFEIAGQAPAGRATARLPDEAGVCLEIMTGAPLPFGADCIVPVERTTRTNPKGITIAADFSPEAGRFIHPRGNDAREGDLLLQSGVLLGSREIGVAASCGAAWLEVSRKPEIAILATGDELVAVDETPLSHQIRQSNAHAIRGALVRAGQPPSHVGTLADDPEVAATILLERLSTCDFLVLTGAVSKGARDFVPALLDSLGCERLFHGVAQRPGKPAGCWIGPSGQIVMALPGNPVSALTGLHAFVLAALAVAAGRPLPKARLLVPAGRFDGLPGMTQHLPVSLGADGRAHAEPTGNSGDFIGLLRSDGFVTIPPRGELAAAFPYTAWF